MRRNSMKFLVLPSLLLLLIFFVYPIITILVKSVTDPEFGFQNYIKFFSQSAYIGALLNTFKIAFLVTAITVILAYPVAYVMTIAPPKIKGLMMLLVLLPFWTALLLRPFSCIDLRNDNGIVNNLLMWLGIVDHPLALINSLTGVVICQVYIILPFMILPKHTTMNSIYRNLLQVAGNFDAAPWKEFLRVFRPL